MNGHNGTPYPFDFSYVLVFVDAQRLYRHASSIVSAFPNIAETTGSDGVLSHRTDLFSVDSV
jgi:hypothetical protein